MDCSDRRGHTFYHLHADLEAHLEVHRMGRQAMNFIFAIFRSFYVDFTVYEL